MDLQTEDSTKIKSQKILLLLSLVSHYLFSQPAICQLQTVLREQYLLSIKFPKSYCILSQFLVF